MSIKMHGQAVFWNKIAGLLLVQGDLVKPGFSFFFFFFSRHFLANVFSLSNPPSLRLQDLENQYRKEKEEADQILEQQRLVRKDTV